MIILTDEDKKYSEKHVYTFCVYLECISNNNDAYNLNNLINMSSKKFLDGRDLKIESDMFSTEWAKLTGEFFMDKNYFSLDNLNYIKTLLPTVGLIAEGKMQVIEVPELFSFIKRMGDIPYC